ncbi:MAG TPA: hypothetical protein VEZ88_07220 [Steroidobacteraceae bacterium]|nr:hypothetical protein [Steroidobacteraceae bacterium]
MTLWQRYLLPAFTFMSVVIGGGYATGRELAEFFMPAGPVGGLLGMLVTACVWGVIFALSLDLARTTQSFDYRSFFYQLLGRGWVLFEIAYLILLLLVLAVLGAASGAIVADLLHTPQWVGVVAFLAVIAVLSWSGRAAIEAFFSTWGVFLFLAYLVFMIVCVAAFGERIEAAFVSAAGPGSGWLSGGLTYAGYNIAIAPALLFCARHQQRRRESLISGLIAGPIAMLPGILFYIAMLARYPEIARAPIPLQVLLHALDAPWLAVGMQIAIFGTLAQTGIGVLHGFNERLLGARADTASAAVRRLRLGVSVGLALIAIVLATRIGLIDLIAKGYGYLAWVIIAIYAVPLLTIGVWRILKSVRLEQQQRAAHSALPAKGET